jgi:ribosome biogenesis GTPase A
VEDTRNKEVEDKVKALKKPLIYVITKSDLVKKEFLDDYRKKLRPMVFVSSKMYFGITKLRERIIITGKKMGKEVVTVGVLGYPNVGKSSLINAVKGTHSAPTSSVAGFTKGVQKIKAGRIFFLDTPGVIPYMEKDRVKHALIGAKDYSRMKDVDLMAMEIILEHPKRIEAYYGINVGDDAEKTLEDIAVKRKILKKGGEPDLIRMGKVIMSDWQKGKV